MGLGERINTFRHSPFRSALPKVEGLNDARTKLAEFFSTLLEVESYLRVGVTKMFADPHLLLVLAQ